MGNDGSNAVSDEVSNEGNNSEGIRVFVYGTLKMDHPNHFFLAEGENTEYLGRCYIKGYQMLNLGPFPGVIVDTGGDATKRVYGEVYRIDDETLDSLDLLEGNGSFYTRYKVLTPWKKAWVYLLPEDFKTHYEFVDSQVASWHPTKDELNYIEEQEKQ